MAETIRSLSRGLQAMLFLSEVGGASCQEIADQLGLSRPTVLRILGTLLDNGLVSMDDHKIYRPSAKMRALGSGLTEKAWALWMAVPALIKLQKEVVWTCAIATFENYIMVQRDSTHLQNPFRIDLREFDDQSRSVLTSAVGRAYLAYCPPEEAEYILSHLERFGDQVDPEGRVDESTRSLLKTIRQQGYALEQRVSYPHISAVAVPIRFDGRVLACIEVIWISRAVRLQEGIKKFLPSLLQAQAEVEHRLASDVSEIPERLI